MPHIDITDAKANLFELIAEAVSGEEVIITENHQPIIKLVPVQQVKHQSQFGNAKGLVTQADDFDEPLEDFEEYM